MQKERLEALLLRQKRELRQRVSKIDHDIRHRELSRQANQQVIERLNDDVLGGLEDEAEQELLLTERALERIARDEFGHCLNCGNEISDERLAIVPHAEFCRHCAQSMEAAAAKSSAHPH